MARKLLTTAVLTFAVGMAVAAPAPAAKIVPCGCVECEIYYICVDQANNTTWLCSAYLAEYCQI